MQASEYILVTYGCGCRLKIPPPPVVAEVAVICPQHGGLIQKSELVVHTWDLDEEPVEEE